MTTSPAYTVLHTGTLANWADKTLTLPDGTVRKGKNFLRDELGTTGCEISINAMPVGGGVPFYHSHKENEEVYFYLGGRGEMQIDGKTFAVAEGDAVRVSKEAERVLRNTGDTVLTFLVIQVREGSLNQCNAADGVKPDKQVIWPA